jgi:putative SOS response-associated peptidase YedK
MPAILPEEHHDAWLSGEAGKELLVPFPADRMKAWPVSPRGNSPKNNDAAIIAPVEVESPFLDCFFFGQVSACFPNASALR